MASPLAPGFQLHIPKPHLIYDLHPTAHTECPNRTLRRAAGFPTAMNLYLPLRSFFLNLHLLFMIRDWLNPLRFGIRRSTCANIAEWASHYVTQNIIWSIMRTFIAMPVPHLKWKPSRKVHLARASNRSVAWPLRLATSVNTFSGQNLLRRQ